MLAMLFLSCLNSWTILLLSMYLSSLILLFLNGFVKWFVLKKTINQPTNMGFIVASRLAKLQSSGEGDVQTSYDAFGVMEMAGALLEIKAQWLKLG